MNKKQLKQSEADLNEAFKSLMTQDAGRKVLTWILEQCHLYQCSLASEETFSALREGERNIGLKILTELNKEPRFYLAMLEKNLADIEIAKNVETTDKQKEKENENDV